MHECIIAREYHCVVNGGGLYLIINVKNCSLYTS